MVRYPFREFCCKIIPEVCTMLAVAMFRCVAAVTAQMITTGCFTFRITSSLQIMPRQRIFLTTSKRKRIEALTMSIQVWVTYIY